jgi:hypothetical protein
MLLIEFFTVSCFVFMMLVLRKRSHRTADAPAAGPELLTLLVVFSLTASASATPPFPLVPREPVDRKRGW